MVEHGRLIDANALMRDIQKYALSDGKFQHWVEVQPTIEPERKKGKWIIEEKHYKGKEQEFYYIEEYCSECGAKRKIGWAEANFCPNCGADMRGEEG